MTQLTKEQLAICAAVGVSEADFLRTLEGLSLAPSRLTAEQLAICAAVGVSEADFLKVHDQQIALGRTQHATR